MYLLICITKAAKQINVKLRRGVMAQMESQKAQELKVPGSSPNQGKTNWKNISFLFGFFGTYEIHL